MYGRNQNRGGDGKGPLEDLWAQLNEPEVLAQELLDEGIRAMKIWPLDRIALRGTGRHITAAELREGLEPFKRIREAVGDQIEIMLEGHGYWDITTAKKIAHAVEEYRPAWLEDMVLGHDVDQLKELKDSTYDADPRERAADHALPVPAADGEARRGHRDDRPDLGGRHHRVAQDRDHGRVVRAAGRPPRLHGAVHADGRRPARVQRTERDLPGDGPRLHPHLVRGIRRRTRSTVEDGHVLPPMAPGIGTSLLPDVFKRPDAHVQKTSA